MSRREEIILNKENFTPQYRHIYDELKSQIQSGEYQVGAQLPFERELCERYGVERITVRKALSLLVDERLIIKKPGLGSFVADAAKGRRAASNTILFLMNKNQNDIRSNNSAFNAQLFFPMEQACRENGYTLLYTGLAAGDDFQELVERFKIAGVFLVSTLPDAVFEQAEVIGIPTICINHVNERFMAIMPDNMSGVRTQVNYLLSLGHRDIAYIKGAPNAVNAAERLDSFKLALFTSGVAIRDEWMLCGGWTYNGGREATAKLLDSTPPSRRPTAIVAASDMMAIGCMDAIRNHGLRVPGDISVAGFDDIDMCKFCTPQLSTVRTDSQAMARVSMEHMLALIKGEKQPDLFTLRLPAGLVHRASVAPPSRR